MNQIYGMSEYKRISFAFVLIVVLRSLVTRLNKIARYFDWTCFGLKEDIKHHEAYYIFLSYTILSKAHVCALFYHDKNRHRQRTNMQHSYLMTDSQAILPVSCP